MVQRCVFKLSSELNWNHLQWKSTNQQLEYTTLNHHLENINSNNSIYSTLLRWFQFSSEEPVLTEISTVTVANNLIVLGLWRWFGVVDSSCWIVNIHCRWIQFSSEERVLTEISTVTGANNLIVLGLWRWLAPVTVDISVSTGSSELNWNHLQWMLTIQQLESTTPNHRHRPSTIKLLAPVTVDISVSTGSPKYRQLLVPTI
jgi:hypothetical protein